MRSLQALMLTGLLSTGMTGCGQKPSAMTRPPEAPSPASATAPPSAASVRETEDKVVAESPKTVESTQEAVQKVADDVARRAQALVEQAKTSLGQKKYADALTALEQLGGLTLNPDQQSLLRDLRAEVAKLGGEIEKGIAGLRSVANQRNYAEGLNLAKQLASYQLTPEQQKVVDSVKSELEKALGQQAGGGARKTLGNLLGEEP